MKYIFPLLFIGALIVPSVAKADIAPDPGFHKVYSCAFFDNLSDYPDYDVYAESQWRFGPSAVSAQSSTEIDVALASQNGCGHIGQPFFAINQDNQKELIHEARYEISDIWYELSENKQYFINATVTGTSNFDYSELVQGDMPDSNPAVTFVSIYHIDTLNDSTFTVRLMKEAMYDEDGKLLSEVTDASTPMDTARSVAPYALLIAIIALGGALLSRVYRNVNRKK